MYRNIGIGVLIALLLYFVYMRGSEASFYPTDGDFAETDLSWVQEHQLFEERKVETSFPANLKELQPNIEASVVDYVRVTASAQKGTLPWESKLLGVPYLPKDTPWPEDVKGRPLIFLAQLNFAEIPPLPGYPQEGVVSFYIQDDQNKEHVWGMYMDDSPSADADGYFQLATEPLYFKVLYHQNIVQDKEKLQAKTRTAENIPVTTEARLHFSMDKEYVSPDDYRFPDIVGSTPYDLVDKYGQEDTYQLFEHIYNPVPMKIGGYGRFVQTDPREEAPPGEDWVLLFDMDSFMTSDGVDVFWGDAGIGSFFIEKTALSNLDFSRVLYYWDNH